MPSSPLSGRHRDALMQHLDGLFALAQVMSPNAEQAVQLVEATFRRAFTTPASADLDVEATGDAEHPEGDDPLPSQGSDLTTEIADLDTSEQARIWLYRLMMQIRNEQVEENGSGAREQATEAVETRTELADLRRQLADEFIDRALPQAFATLPSEQRMLLMLCDVERMGCEDAGRVMDLDPAVSCVRLEKAHVSLHRALYANATAVERQLLETGLPINWKRAALQRMAESRLVTVPPTLRPSIVSIFKSMSQRGRGTGIDVSDADEPTDQHVSGGSPWPALLKKFSAVLAIIAVAGLLGYGFSYFALQTPNPNLISLSARQAESVEAHFETSSAEQAERYIYERLGNRVTLPTIADASLQGVSIRSVVDRAEVPILLYEDASTGRPITVYVYSYAFLDRHQKDLVLERDILRQIEAEGNFDLHDLGEEKALVWRYRDDIFIAITSDDAEALRGRIAFPS